MNRKEPDNPSMHPSALIIMAKQPVPGITKTRLCPPFNHEQASRLYECMLLDTIATTASITDTRLVLSFWPPTAYEYFRAAAPGFELEPQVGSSLGQRLHHALTACLASGCSQAVAISSDSPTISRAYLMGAFDSLSAGADLVLGPCHDGGYSLIGLTRPVPRLLLDVEMSTHTVTPDTMKIAVQENLRAVLLEPCLDVDLLTDLDHLVAELRSAPPETAPLTRVYLCSIGILEPAS